MLLSRFARPRARLASIVAVAARAIGACARSSACLELLARRRRGSALAAAPLPPRTRTPPPPQFAARKTSRIARGVAASAPKRAGRFALLRFGSHRRGLRACAASSFAGRHPLRRGLFRVARERTIAPPHSSRAGEVGLRRAAPTPKSCFAALRAFAAPPPRASSKPASSPARRRRTIRAAPSVADPPGAPRHVRAPGVRSPERRCVALRAACSRADAPRCARRSRGGGQTLARGRGRLSPRRRGAADAVRAASRACSPRSTQPREQRLEFGGGARPSVVPRRRPRSRRPSRRRARRARPRRLSTWRRRAVDSIAAPCAPPAGPSTVAAAACLSAGARAGRARGERWSHSTRKPSTSRRAVLDAAEDCSCAAAPPRGPSKSRANRRAVAPPPPGIGALPLSGRERCERRARRTSPRAVGRLRAFKHRAGLRVAPVRRGERAASGAVVQQSLGAVAGMRRSRRGNRISPARRRGAVSGTPAPEHARATGRRSPAGGSSRRRPQPAPREPRPPPRRPRARRRCMLARARAAPASTRSRSMSRAAAGRSVPEVRAAAKHRARPPATAAAGGDAARGPRCHEAAAAVAVAVRSRAPAGADEASSRAASAPAPRRRRAPDSRPAPTSPPRRRARSRRRRVEEVGLSAARAAAGASSWRACGGGVFAAGGLRELFSRRGRGLALLEALPRRPRAPPLAPAGARRQQRKVRRSPVALEGFHR